MAIGRGTRGLIQISARGGGWHGGVPWQMTQFTRNELCKLRLISFATLPLAVVQMSNVEMKCISQISCLPKGSSILPAILGYKLPNLIKAKLAAKRVDSRVWVSDKGTASYCG